MKCFQIKIVLKRNYLLSSQVTKCIRKIIELKKQISWRVLTKNKSMGNKRVHEHCKYLFGKVKSNWKKTSFTINCRNNKWKSMIDLVLIGKPEISNQKNVT